MRALASLRVRGRAPRTGFARDRFGPAWLDVDRNGCDTRNDTLRAQLARVAIRPGTSGCVAERGVLLDPYGGAAIPFLRGARDVVDVDHVVSLGNAWVSGAWRWRIAGRAALANDPENLLAVSASLNRQKGDGDAATWLPPARGFRCRYVARQIAVKQKYGLSVTPAERNAMVRILAACAGESLPAPSGWPTTSDLRIDDPGGPESGGTGRSSSPSAGGPMRRISFASCAAVRAAGRGPLRLGHPGYSRRLDGDGDGVACEAH